MHNNRAGLALATLSQHRRLVCHHLGMRWETNILRRTFRRKGHYRVAEVMGTTHNNISTSPVAIRTEVPQRHPLGRALGIIHNNPIAASWMLALHFRPQWSHITHTLCLEWSGPSGGAKVQYSAVNFTKMDDSYLRTIGNFC